jgi:hypothetical protein
MASKKLKKVLKAALIGGAGLLAAKGLGKRRLSKAVSGTDDAGLGVSHFKDYITKKAKPPVIGDGMWDSPWGAKGGGIAKRGKGAAYKSGGRVKSMGIAKRGGGVAKR